MIPCHRAKLNILRRLSILKRFGGIAKDINCEFHHFNLISWRITMGDLARCDFVMFDSQMPPCDESKNNIRDKTPNKITIFFSFSLNFIWPSQFSYSTSHIEVYNIALNCAYSN